MEITLFFIAAAIALSATTMMITGVNAVHSLLYLIVSLLSVALLFFLLGAHFAAALEVIIYAGAIMVMFVFVVMMLNQGQAAVAQELARLRPRIWILPSLLALALLAETLFVIFSERHAPAGVVVGPKQVGMALFGPYLLVVELASMLLLAGLVSAFYLGRPVNREAGSHNEHE